MAANGVAVAAVTATPTAVVTNGGGPASSGPSTTTTTTTSSTPTSAAPVKKLPLRVLCFGDSLTAGTTSWGNHYHPYGPRLGEVLTERLGSGGGGASSSAALSSSSSSGYDVAVTVDGRPGDMTVTPPGFMVDRMHADCEFEPPIR